MHSIDTIAFILYALVIIFIVIANVNGKVIDSTTDPRISRIILRSTLLIMVYVGLRFGLLI